MVSSTADAGLDHHDDGAGRFHGGGEFGDGGAGDEAVGERAGRGHGLGDPLGRAVVNRDGEALLGHVEREVAAHDGKTHEGDVGGGHDRGAPLRFTSMKRSRP